MHPVWCADLLPNLIFELIYQYMCFLDSLSAPTLKNRRDAAPTHMLPQPVKRYDAVPLLCQ